MLRRAVLLAGCLASAACRVRAPAPVDVLALTRADGDDGARRELVARVLASPRDVQARLALALLADRLGRPSEAIAQLDEVAALGGPLGVRWHDDDRARLARLLHARGRVRLARGAASAEADLRRAASLGADVPAAELAQAREAGALAALRHADAEVRADGRRVLAELGARMTTPAERAALGQRLWDAGARRAAWDELAAWHDAVPPPRDPAAQAAYVRALAWWSPLWLGDVPPPPAGELAGPDACRFPGAGCRAGALADTDAGAALARSPIDPGARAVDPADALGWLELGLRGALRGDAAWGTTVRARVDVATVLADPALAPDARELLAEVAGVPAPRVVTGAHPVALPAILRAALRARAGATADEVRMLLGAEATTPDGEALLAIAQPSALPAAEAGEDLRAAAVARYVRGRVPDAPTAATLVAIARAYRRDPSSAERLARDAVATAPDAAAAQAAMGAAFEALLDPARARAAWQAAVDASREPAYLAGLAAAIAKANDPDAALIVGTAAAAASGDPAVTWLPIARALIGSHALPQALTATRSAIDLAGPDALPAALDLAITASRALGRDAQVADLMARRARLAPAVDELPGPDRPDLEPAWQASRWSPRDVAGRAALLHALPPADPRARRVQLELVALAADPDPVRALAAAQALP